MGFSSTIMLKMEVPALTFPVLSRTLFVAAMPVPASPSGGQRGQPGSRSPSGSSSAAPSEVSLPASLTSIADDAFDGPDKVTVTARKGTISYKNALERLPDELQKHFSGKNLMIIFPDQYGEATKDDHMSFTEAQHKEESSIYDSILRFMHRKAKKEL